jgi:hypothetical protein
MARKRKNDERNPIAWREVLIVAGIIITVAALGFTLLNSNVEGKFTSLDTRITDLNTSLNTRITDLNRRIADLMGIGVVGDGGGAGIPFPVAGKLPEEKIKEISKSALLSAEPGEEVLMVPAGDYVVLPLQFKFGESATIEWQVISATKENLIDFYLLDEEGYIYIASVALISTALLGYRLMMLYFTCISPTYSSRLSLRTCGFDL